MYNEEDLTGTKYSSNDPLSCLFILLNTCILTFNLYNV